MRIEGRRPELSTTKSDLRDFFAAIPMFLSDLERNEQWSVVGSCFKQDKPTFSGTIVDDLGRFLMAT
jgi:hypothetical protein